MEKKLEGGSSQNEHFERMMRWRCRSCRVKIGAWSAMVGLNAWTWRGLCLWFLRLSGQEKEGRRLRCHFRLFLVFFFFTPDQVIVPSARPRRLSDMQQMPNQTQPIPNASSFFIFSPTNRFIPRLFHKTYSCVSPCSLTLSTYLSKWIQLGGRV